jgi:hypothetical protein
MKEEYYLYLFGFIITFLISSILSFYTYKNRSSQSHIFFILINISIVIWSLGSLFEFLAIDIPTKIFWAKVCYLGVATVAPFLFMFTLSYGNYEKYIKMNNIIFLMLIPAIVVILVFTNEWHGLIWSQANLINTVVGPVIVYNYNIGATINLIYSYSLLLASIFILIYILINSAKIYKFQVLAILLGILFPFIFNIIYALNLFNISANITSISFTITAIMLSIGVFKYELLDVLPLAHNKIFENMGSAYMVFDYQNRLLEINKNAEMMFKINNNDIGKPLNLILDDDGFRSVYYDANIHNTEMRLKIYDNNWVSIQKTRIDYSRTDYGCLVIITDIGKRKKYEIDLKESQRALNTLISNLQGIVYRCNNDKKWTMKFMSSGCLELTGYSSEDFINNNKKSYGSIINPKDQEHILEEIQNALLKKEPFEIIYRIKTCSGGEKFVWEKGRGVFSKEDDVIALEGFITDLTALINAEKGLKKSLKEKEILLKEIHHRVKNNMQIISSLLNLQSKYIETKTPEEILKETQDRIKTMSLVHEKLYNSQDIEKIDFGDYLEGLVLILARSYDTSYLKIQVNASHIFMDINSTIPCGLIVNELITNAIKHAFPENVHGKINVDFYKEEDNLKLIIRDNGVGIPEDIDIENVETLGLNLLISLVNQLDASLKIDTANGTSIEITFKELK